ncbi:hypothetical protein M569_02878 [Genlisea aurea]|uniref:Uncharacterized protein n=1 Tax=Genlisea aurea TaxID=192259 RepID=S8D3B0_9LAMI|nr:hypothetical protein M569_02878 [Genlisea aurea]
MSLTGSSELREAPQAGSGSADSETKNGNESPSEVSEDSSGSASYYSELPEASSGRADGETNTDGILPFGLRHFLHDLDRPYIYRVYEQLREINPAAYEPNVITIGPYHHGKEKRRMMEGEKILYLKSFLHRNNQVSKSKLISLVAAPALPVKFTYSEHVCISSPELETMIVMDACFIIELALRFRRIVPLGDVVKETERELGEIKHLLGLIHSSWEPPQNDNLNRDHENISSWRLIGSATDLEEANIRFEKQENSMKSWFDIEFADGILRIPTIVIEDRTESFIRNLMAYELHRQVNGRNFITDYAVFLHCLINSSADAKLLQSKGIIENRLGDNEAVASFLKKIMVSLPLPDQSTFRYTKMFQEINKFQDKKLNRYMAILRRDYFNSPWTISSFVAATVKGCASQRRLFEKGKKSITRLTNFRLIQRGKITWEENTGVLVDHGTDGVSDDGNKTSGEISTPIAEVPYIYKVNKHLRGRPLPRGQREDEDDGGAQNKIVSTIFTGIQTYK